jgi:hypothetical protein
MRIAWSELRASFGSQATISPPSSDFLKASATQPAQPTEAPRHPLPTCLFVGGSNTTVTLRLPQAGHISLDSRRESGKFGPRVQTNVSRSSCFR